MYVCFGFNKSSGWNGYSDFTSSFVTTAAGRLMGIAVTPGYPAKCRMPKVYTRIWIDWNGDGDFTDNGAFG